MNELSIEEKLIRRIKKMPEDQQRSLLNEIKKRQKAYRDHPRLESSIPANYIIEDKTYKDFIKNISAGGVFIATNKSQYVDHEVSLYFRLSGYEKPIKVFGRIVRSDHNGFAVKFYEKVEELLNITTQNKKNQEIE